MTMTLMPKPAITLVEVTLAVIEPGFHVNSIHELNIVVFGESSSLICVIRHCDQMGVKRGGLESMRGGEVSNLTFSGTQMLRRDLLD